MLQRNPSGPPPPTYHFIYSKSSLLVCIHQEETKGNVKAMLSVISHAHCKILARLQQSVKTNDKIYPGEFRDKRWSHPEDEDKSLPCSPLSNLQVSILPPGFLGNLEHFLEKFISARKSRDIPFNVIRVLNTVLIGGMREDVVISARRKNFVIQIAGIP